MLESLDRLGVDQRVETFNHGEKPCWYPPLLPAMAPLQTSKFVGVEVQWRRGAEAARRGAIDGTGGGFPSLQRLPLRSV